MGFFESRMGCLNLEEMKINMPKSLLLTTRYFQTYLFLYTSTTFGYINFAEEVKNKQFVRIAVPPNDFAVVQPIFLKNFHQNPFSDSRPRDWARRSRAGDQKKDFYDDSFLEGGLAEDSAKVTMEMLQKIKGQEHLFFVAIKPWKIDLFSQTSLIKSFPLVVPDFDPEISKKKKFDTEAVKKTRERKLREQKNHLEELSRRQRIKSSSDFFHCKFKKRGLHSTYHESLPQYMFVLVYNCQELFRKKTGGDFLEKRKTLEDEQYYDPRKNFDLYKNQIYNQFKIATIEILSDQFVLINSLVNIENKLENYGQIRLFKNFREYLVVVFKPRLRQFKRHSVRVMVKQFDKYNGFKTVLDRKLHFYECSTPFYDILYSYNKNSNEKEREKNVWKYSFNESYNRGQGSLTRPSEQSARYN